MNLLLAISRLLVAAYPATIRAEFGPEMEAVHRTVLRAAAAHGPLHLLLAIGREWGGLLGGLLAAHYERFVEKPMNQRIATLLNGITLGGVIILFALFLWVVYYFSLAMTEIFLTPWDTMPNPYPESAWQFQLNRFFSLLPGSILPSLALLIASLYSAWQRLRHPQRTALLARWTAFQLAIIMVMSVALIRLEDYQFFLSGRAGSYQVGYHVTWPGIVILLGLVLMNGFFALRHLPPQTVPLPIIATEQP